jgi:hypothetical protein
LPAIIDGGGGAVRAMGAQVRAAFPFPIGFANITGIDLLMRPGPLAEFAVKID